MLDLGEANLGVCVVEATGRSVQLKDVTNGQTLRLRRSSDLPTWETLYPSSGDVGMEDYQHR